MNIHVYDTYVEAKDGHTMHFDVYTAEKNDKKAFEYAKQWLASIGEIDAKVTSDECSFCHVQGAKPDQEKAIKETGYFIYKMGGCPN